MCTEEVPLPLGEQLVGGFGGTGSGTDRRDLGVCAEPRRKHRSIKNLGVAISAIEKIFYTLKKVPILIFMTTTHFDCQACNLYPFSNAGE